MIRARFPLAFACWAVFAVSVATSGCRPPATPSANGSTARSAPPRPAPEESFQQIVDIFKQAVDTNTQGEQTGFLVRDGGGHSRLSIRNEVSHKIIPPGKEGEPYRGTITVASHYSYSLLIPAAGSDEGKTADDDRKSRDAAQGQSDDPSLDSSGVDVLDQDLVATTPRSDNPLSGPSDDVIARRTDEDVRTYELVYKNNRWVLTTTLDPKTERSIQYAFDHALGTQ